MHDTKDSGSRNEHRTGHLQHKGRPHDLSRIPLRSTLLCVKVKVKVNVVLEQATKAQRESTGTALLFL